MKRSRLPIAVLVICGVSLLLRAQRTPPLNAQEIRQQGKEIVAAAASTLSSNLMSAITHGGMTNAINFCSMHALPLTESTVTNQRVMLRRVSTKVRNRENIADGIEQRVIERYTMEIKKGLTPGPLVEEFQGEARYFEPIVIMNPLCLNCHGDPLTQIRPDTLALIKRFYPEDAATGFKMKELRGIWSVSFKAQDSRAKKRSQ